jgi:pyruvate dehydrogenase (quinone)
MAKEIVADIVADTLAPVGVRGVYGVAGARLRGITDSLHRKYTIQWIHTLHEDTAALAAGADAQLTGSVAVCVGSCCLDHPHLISGLVACRRSGVPVLAIASYTPGVETGHSRYKESQLPVLFEQCSNYYELVSTPAQMPRVLDMAIQTATSRQGVSVIVLPEDVALQAASDLSLPNLARPAESIASSDTADLH